MLADPDLADLDEIKKSLVDLKGSGRPLETPAVPLVRPVRVPIPKRISAAGKTALPESGQVADGKSDFETTRRVVHSFVDRIDIDPKSISGKLILPADAKACLESEFITRVALGDPRRVEGEG